MDALLEQRYTTLFYSFDTERDALTGELKERILRETKYLRPDAALCLLTLFDHMIVKPYHSEIFGSGLAGADNPPLPKPEVGLRRDFESRVFQSFDLILERLRAGHEPASSHDVLQVIESVWPQLSNLFAWA